jgi:hypothetical protein
VDAKDVVLHGSDMPPAAAKLLLDTLNQKSPKKHVSENGDTVGGK